MSRRRPLPFLLASPSALTAVTAALGTLAALALLTCAAPAQAADAPASLNALLAGLPELPATVQEAATWVDASSGRVVQPKLEAVVSGLQAHLRAVGAIARADDSHRQAQADTRQQDLMKGMADIGIDPARMQRDPAYARQVQERMRSMPPEQLMAMAQKMNQPMQQDKRLVNESTQVADETLAVRAAGDAGEAYARVHGARAQARQATWREANEQAARIVSAPLQTRLPKPRTEWENPGCDSACSARWQAYAGEALPLMLARESEALRLRRATLQKLRGAIAAEVQAGDRQLSAAQYGAAARSQTYLLRIATYDGALAGEVQQLADWTAEAVRPAAELVHCGKQAVLAPGTVCP